MGKPVPTMRLPPSPASVLPNRMNGEVREAEAEAVRSSTAPISSGRVRAPSSGREGGTVAQAGKWGALPRTRRRASSQCLRATRCKIIPSAQKNTFYGRLTHFPQSEVQPPPPSTCRAFVLKNKKYVENFRMTFRHKLFPSSPSSQTPLT